MNLTKSQYAEPTPALGVPTLYQHGTGVGFSIEIANLAMNHSIENLVDHIVC